MTQARKDLIHKLGTSAVCVRFKSCCHRLLNTPDSSPMCRNHVSFSTNSCCCVSCGVSRPCDTYAQLSSIVAPDVPFTSPVYPHFAHDVPPLSTRTLSPKTSPSQRPAARSASAGVPLEVACERDPPARLVGERLLCLTAAELVPALVGFGRVASDGFFVAPPAPAASAASNLSVPVRWEGPTGWTVEAAGWVTAGGAGLRGATKGCAGADGGLLGSDCDHAPRIRDRLHPLPSEGAAWDAGRKEMAAARPMATRQHWEGSLFLRA